MTACVIGLAFGQLVAGPLSDAVGRRGPIVLGLGAWSVASVVFQFTVGGVVAPLVGVLGTTSVLPLAAVILACLAVALVVQTTAQPTAVAA